MNMSAMRSAVVGALLSALAVPQGASAATAVDTELGMLVDVSGSVDNSEYALQLQGYINAFNDPAVRASILSTAGGRLGRIAVEMVMWSSGNQQASIGGWHLLDSSTAIDSFVSVLSAAVRPFSGLTGIGNALTYGTDSMNANAFDGAVRVLDVSGDGDSNSGISAAAGRDYALANGVSRINGIAIGDASLLNYYATNVIGGTNAFALQANNFATFDAAIKRKLAAEITGGNPDPVPLPAAGWMLVSGFGALMGMRRLRRKPA